jgi:DNA replicative helicase MCM subunit Mcm2 (Cdc46/Mcm family)
MEINPLIPDGFNGPIKRLSCASCRHYFYVSQKDYQSFQPLYCHECSLKRVELERRKAKNPVFKEAVEQAEQGIKEVVC